MVMELVVTDLVLLGDIPATATAACAVSLTSFEQVGFDTTPDFTFSLVNATAGLVAAGTTKLAEVAGVVNVTSVGLAWDVVPHTFVLTTNGTTTWLGVARSSIEADLRNSSAAVVAAAASEMLAVTRSVPAAQLLAEHTYVPAVSTCFGDHFSRISQLYTTPRTPRDAPYFAPMRVGC